MRSILFLTLALATFLAVAPTQTVLAASTCRDADREHSSCLKSNSLEKCDLQVLKDYTGTLYKEVNQSLRGLGGDCKSASEAILRALQTLPPLKERTTVYRGTKVPPRGLTSLRVGDCFLDPAFVSTSRHQGIADGFKSTGVFFVIEAMSGRDISGVSGLPNEKEVLLFPGTIFKLTEKVAGDTVFKLAEALVSECSTDSFPAVLSAVQASFGGNIDPEKSQGNATKDASAYCVKGDGKTCDYEVLTKYLGDPFPGQEKSFEIQWSCTRITSSVGTYSVRIPAPSEGAKFKFGCERDGKPQVDVQQLPAELIHVVIDQVGSATADHTKVVQGLYPTVSSILRLEVAPKDLGITVKAAKASKPIDIAYQCVSKAGSVGRAARLVWSAEKQLMKAELNCHGLVAVKTVQ